MTGAIADRPLRVVFVVGSLGPGGAERFVAGLANRWVGAGHEVTILMVAKAEDPIYPLDDRIGIEVIDTYRPSHNPLRTITSMSRRVAALRRRLDAIRPDAAIGVMTYPSSLLGIVGRCGAGLMIGSEHNHPPMERTGLKLRTIRRLAYGRLDTVVALTDESRDWLLGNTRATRADVIPIPVTYPLPTYEPVVRPDSVLSPDRKLVVGIGRLSAQKRFDRLISAFGAVSGTRPDWDLAILGEGADRAALTRQIEDAGLSGRAHLVGQVGNVAEWFGRADLFALTSSHEGFPNVLLEAMAHGVAPLSVDCQTGPSLIIRDGIDGRLVPQDDAVALVAAMGRMMDDDADRDRLAARAVEARDRFSMDRIAAEWEALIRQGPASR